MPNETVLSYTGLMSKEQVAAEMQQWLENNKIIQTPYEIRKEKNLRNAPIACLLAETNLERGLYRKKSGIDFAPDVLGWPVWFALLVDAIFKGLPAAEAMLFPLQVIQAIPRGIDLSPVKTHFHIYLIQAGDFDRVAFPQVEAARQAAIKLLERRLAGDEPSSSAWAALEDASKRATEDIALKDSAIIAAKDLDDATKVLLRRPGHRAWATAKAVAVQGNWAINEANAVRGRAFAAGEEAWEDAKDIKDASAASEAAETAKYSEIAQKLLEILAKL